MRQIRDEVVALKDLLQQRSDAGMSLARIRVRDGTFPVLGEGSHNARLMFVGEAPGRNEAATGRPFCGAAGKILDTLCASIGLERKDVYVTNIVKDRPPQNRDPLPEEIELYAPFLDRQIAVIQPSVIVTLGRFSMEYILKRFGLAEYLGPISRLHGQIFSASSSYGIVKIVPLYHPAAAIYNPTLKDDLLRDFAVLKDFAGMVRGKQESHAEPVPPSLF